MPTTSFESFPYIAKPDARVLILGSMPSVASIKAGMYYAHPRNTFWRILASLCDSPPLEDTESRISFLHEKHIALWDSARECIREGSADHTIREVKPNDLASIFGKCPDIRHIFLNGTKAHELFERYTSLTIPPTFTGLPCTLLPSTSPANTIPYELKLKSWKIVCETADFSPLSDRRITE